MATLYLDFENGNDNYAGTSFALLAQGTDGRITTATFSSATASFPNDGSLIGQYLSIFNGSLYAVYNITAWVSATSLTIAVISGGTALANQAVDRQFYIGGRWKNITTGATAVRTVAGDTIRIMGSPAPTSLGQNGVWTSQALQATKNITSSTNATPIAITCTAHGYSTGDTVVITGHTTNTNANGTWEITNTGANTFTLDGSVGNGVGGATGTVRLRNNTRVKLTTAVTQNIASTGPGRAAWTNAMGANGSAALSTSAFKEHNQADRITVNTAFTTGKAAYYTLPSTLDLSGYQQVSFWFASQAAVLTAGQLDLRLCSDTVGDVTVNTISIPAVPATGRFQAFTIDTGNALSSSIQSIALYVNTDVSTTGNCAFDFNNIIACKASSAADSLTLTSLIGKNTTGETFWGIQSINGTRVMLDGDTSNAPSFAGPLYGYFGTSATVTTWKRETIKLGPAALNSTALQTVQESGTDGSPITYSGGWDRTNMSTQSLETWLDGLNGFGYALNTSSSFINATNMAFVRFTRALSFFGLYNICDVVAANNCGGSQSVHVFSLTNSNTLTLGHAMANGAYLFTNNSGTGFVDTGPIIRLNYLLQTVVRVAEFTGNHTVVGLTSAAEVLNTEPGNTFFRLNSGASGTYKNIRVPSFSALTGTAAVYLTDVVITDTTEFSGGVPLGTIVYSHNHDQTAGNHKIFLGGGLISAATDQRKTASGISWKIQPTSATIRHSRNPIIFSLAKVACSANNLVTIKAWMYRDNSGLTMRLVCKGDQIAGVASDVTASVTTTNAWEELTITFTPTETGVVEITAEAWGGTTFSGWVDDMTISQA
jgi:hypothetical protein